MGGRVGLIGYFGWGNFGDELFLSQWQEVIGVAQTFRVNDLLQKPYTSRPAAVVAEDSEAFVIGGGDLIRTESISSLYWNRAWTEKPIVISGVGVARESDRQRSDVVPRLKSFIASAQILSFSARDPESLRWIEENLRPSVEVRLVPDLAYAAVHAGHSRPRRQMKTVGVVLNKRITAHDLNVFESLMEAESAGVLKLRLLVLATGVQRDHELEQLELHGLHDRAETFEGVADMVKAIGGVDLLYSAKFHGLVVASSQGIPSRSLRRTSKAVSLSTCLGMPMMTSMTIPRALPSRAELDAESNQLSRLGPALGSLARAELEHVRSVLETVCTEGH
jgi:polysaccharide pyruvyl transferase WcaK-like protein